MIPLDLQSIGKYTFLLVQYIRIEKLLILFSYLVVNCVWFYVCFHLLEIS